MSVDAVDSIIIGLFAYGFGLQPALRLSCNCLLVELARIDCDRRQRTTFCSQLLNCLLPAVERLYYFLLKQHSQHQ